MPCRSMEECTGELAIQANIAVYFGSMSLSKIHEAVQIATAANHSVLGACHTHAAHLA